MKKIILLLVILLVAITGLNAQGYLKKLGKSVQDKTQQKTEQTVDKALGKVFDAVDGLITGKKKKDKKNKKDKNKGEDEDDEGDENAESEAEEKVPATWDCPNPDCGHTKNSGKFCEECGTKRPGNKLSLLSEVNGKYVTKNIFFATGTTEIGLESLAELQKIANFMQSNPKARLIIQVLYLGSKTNNLEDAFCEDRAEKIIKALVNIGCDEFCLKAEDSDYDKENERPKVSEDGLYTIFTRK